MFSEGWGRGSAGPLQAQMGRAASPRRRAAVSGIWPLQGSARIGLVRLEVSGSEREVGITQPVFNISDDCAVLYSIILFGINCAVLYYTIYCSTVQ